MLASEEFRNGDNPIATPIAMEINVFLIIKILFILKVTRSMY